MNSILLVDDDANVLAALKRELMMRKDEFSIDAFVSPMEALKYAKTKSFDLVISDYKMPEMDGLSFLNEFQVIQPDTARILLSGQADRETLVDAINRTRIYRFIMKPWDQVELAGAITQALAYRKVAMENRWLVAEYHLKHGEWPVFFDPAKHHQVLVVDDESNVLSAVARDLSHRSPLQDLYAVMLHDANPELPQDNHNFHFIVETATSPLEALEQAQLISYDLVISDYKMPDMDGARFLEAFRKIQPDAARILLSGQADMKALMDAINRSEIYAFIAKPWNDYDLKSTVTQAILYRNLQLENQRLAHELRHEGAPI
jgi:DNA-binding NtrC family response regulator